jgi:hypothetical protein
MAMMRVMFVGHGPSNLPEDRVVNTFHFNDSSAYGTHVEQITTALSRFYTGTPSVFTGVTNPVGAWLSPWVQRAAELRFYDLTTAPPRVPTIVPMTLPAPIAGSGLPEEVAVCLSIQTDVAPFSARRRGRLFIGPLCNSAMFSAESTHSSRPAALFQADLAASAVGLCNAGASGWAIRSTRPTQNFVLVGRGWIDDAFDTQRRRGPKPASRLNWVCSTGL